MRRPQWALVLAGLVACGAVWTNALIGQSQPAGTGEISGRVVDRATGRPIGGATVSVYQVPDGPTVFPWVNEGNVIVTGSLHLGSVMTNADGQFAFSGLPRGGFEVSAYRDRKSTRLNSSHIPLSRMPSSA